MNDISRPATSELTDADRVRIIVGVLTCMLLAALDQTIVAPVIPAIGAALGQSDYISWIMSAYFLAATATTPLYGKIADINGRRPVLLAALSIFVVGSVICAAAGNMMMLIVGRAVQGLGGGGLMALAQTVIGDLFPPRERGKISGYIAATWAIASIAGPVLGGVITEHLSWTIIFWLNLPLAGFAVWTTYRALARVPWNRRDHKLDVMGSALVVATTVALMLALTLAPQAGMGWTSMPVLGLIALFVALLPVLVRHLLTTPEPLIPLEVLGNRIVLLATFSVFFGMMALIGLSVYVPLFVVLSLGKTVSVAGFALVGYMIGTVIGANTAGRTLARVTNYKRLPIMGLSVATAGLGWLAWRAPTIGLLELELVLILIGIGSGPQFPVVTVSVQNAVDPRDIGVATGVMAFMRALGLALGVAVIGAVGAATGLGAAGHEGRSDAAAVTHVAPAAFAPVLLAAALCLAAALFLLALMPTRPLRGR